LYTGDDFGIFKQVFQSTWLVMCIGIFAFWQFFNLDDKG